MSHGSSSGNEKAEPNLVPMLDMVLQLVMFFIMVANFTQDQVSKDVMLPVAQSARLGKDGDGDVIYLNLNAEGKLIVPGRELPLSSIAEVHTYLKQEYSNAEESARAKSGASAQVKTVIIIRGHKDSDWAPIINVLQQAKKAGFKKWQLKANIINAVRAS